MFKYCYQKNDKKRTPFHFYMENKDGFRGDHMQIWNAPFMTYLEKLGPYILQLLVLQLYLTPFMPSMHISSKEPS